MFAHSCPPLTANFAALSAVEPESPRLVAAPAVERRNLDARGNALWTQGLAAV